MEYQPASGSGVFNMHEEDGSIKLSPQLIDNIIVMHREKPFNLTVQTINWALELGEEEYKRYTFPAQYETRIWAGHPSKRDSRLLSIYGSGLEHAAMFIHKFMVDTLLKDSASYLDDWLT